MPFLHLPIKHFHAWRMAPVWDIPMTNERASQVSHSSWRTKASHNKSRLIPGPSAPPKRKTKRWVLLTKGSYYSREPHVATLSIKLWHDREAWMGCFYSFNVRKSKVFSFHSPLPTSQVLSMPFTFFFYFLITSTCSLLSNYRLVFHLHGQGMEW